MATTTATTTKDSRDNGAAIVEQQQKANVPALNGPRLPFHPLVEQRFGIDRASWKALVEAIFPNATSVESVVLALSYCKARKLDPFKRNVHIVPIYDKNRRCMVDTVWPGIGELRTTAHRTGDFAGRGETVFGPDLTMKVGNTEMTFPEWAQVTVYRMVKGQRVGFAGPRVYWLETYATKKRDDDSPNEMWETRPRGQIDKCAEAAALRAAFPEEIGSDYVADEVGHQKADPPIATQARRTLDDLESQVALEGPKSEESSEAEQAGDAEVTPITFDSLSVALENAKTHAELDGIARMSLELPDGDRADLDPLIEAKRASLGKSK